MQNYTFTTRNTNIRIKTSPKRRSALSTIFLVAGVLIVVTLFIQLYVMSVFATKGEDIAKLEAKKAVLINENKKLTQEIAHARQYDFIKEQSENLGFVDITANDVNYLTIE